MGLDFYTLRERSIQNLTDFLNTEVDLGVVFARLAKYYREKGNSERYETSKRNALATLEAIDHFKGRLPYGLRMQIEMRRFELTALVRLL